MNYRDKVILAPMVRIGTLPMRLLALRYGCDIVYCEELVDVKLLRSKRVENQLLGSVDFIDLSDGSVVFRTCPEEAGRVVLQIGTASEERAAAIVEKFQDDVAAFDVNMGCPKEFSLKGGMGAALLDNPEKIQAILTSMLAKSRVPVTCKIRVKPCLEETKKLVKIIESTGVAAVAVHGRTRDERPRHDNRNHYIAAVVETVSLPVIANGGSKDITCYEDIQKFKTATKAASVMVARAAELNCSVFRKEGPLGTYDVIKEYLKVAVDFDNQANNTKYAVQNMLGPLQHETPEGLASIKCQTLEELCLVWGLGDYYREVNDARFEKAIKLSPGPTTDLVWSVTDPCRKKLKLDSEEATRKGEARIYDGDVVEMSLSFVRRYYADEDLPRTLLFMHAKKGKKPPPKFETWQMERLFKSVVTFDGKKYTSHPGEKSRRYAEQAAAMVCLKMLGIELRTRVMRCES